MNRKQLMIVVCGLAIALGVPATGAAASGPVGPVDHFHNVFADSGNVCGIDVAETESISDETSPRSAPVPLGGLGRAGASGMWGESAPTG